jgi:hypothetical protein
MSVAQTNLYSGAILGIHERQKGFDWSDERTTQEPL